MATTFAQHLERLEALLRKDGDAPAWEGVLVVRECPSFPRDRQPIRRSDLCLPAEFEGIFEEIANRGYVWINLVANGLINGKLIVSLEFPDSPGVRQGETPVSMAGPYLDENGEKMWELQSC